MTVPESARRPRPKIYQPGVYPRGAYVVATKYADGDPGDQWCVGFYYGTDDGTWPRHYVVDGNGLTFRHNGFRRVERVGTARGCWLVKNIPMIQRHMDRRSVWHWVHAPWRELELEAAFEELGG